MTESVPTIKTTKKNALSVLKGKKKRRKAITVDVDGNKVKLVFQAISAVELDKLQAAHPPTDEQRRNGSVFNKNTFPAALVAACSVDPEISYDDAQEIFTSDAWSAGELNALFDTVSNLCMQGLDIPFSGSASDTTQPSD